MKQAETPLVAISSPPTAGPNTRAMFWTTSYRPDRARGALGPDEIEGVDLARRPVDREHAARREREHVQDPELRGAREADDGQADGHEQEQQLRR